MGIPQITILALFGVSLLLAANQHGKSKQGKNSIWITLFAVALELSLLFWGGFFK